MQPSQCDRASAVQPGSPKQGSQTMSTPNEKVIKKLNDLIELDFDAIEAYEAAIERLESPEYRSKLNEYCEDHRRHTRDLTAQVTRLGGSPETGPGAMRLLTK